jgi:hypothetical protein
MAASQIRISRGLNGFNGWAQQISFECAHPLDPFNPRLIRISIRAE